MKEKKGSILISTISILSVVMVTIITFVSISRIERQAATSSNDSLIAYHRADSGAEDILFLIVDGFSTNGSPDDGKTETVFSEAYWHGGLAYLECNSETGIIEKGSENDLEYRVQLYKRDAGNPTKNVVIGCDDTTTPFSEIVRIKSIGVLPGKATRAIEADVPIPEGWQ